MVPVDEKDAHEPDGDGGLAPAVVGSAGIALLIGAALVVGAVPYTIALLGVGLLPYPGGVRDLGMLDLLLRAGGAFLIFALAEPPAEITGKTVAFWRGSRDHSQPQKAARRAQRTGRITAQLLKGGLLAVLLYAWVTNTLTAAIVVAGVTIVLESVLEPLVDRHVKS